MSPRSVPSRFRAVSAVESVSAAVQTPHGVVADLPGPGGGRRADSGRALDLGMGPWTAADRRGFRAKLLSLIGRWLPVVSCPIHGGGVV